MSKIHWVALNGVNLLPLYDKEVEADKLLTKWSQLQRGRFTADLTEKKTVLINTAYEGTWYMPGVDSYAAILIKDAGGAYLWDASRSSAFPVDFEVVVERSGC